MEEFLVASADGGARLGTGKYIEPENSGPAAPVRITLNPSRAIAIHARDAAGKPVSGAAIEAVGFEFQDSTATDDRGNAHLLVPSDAAVRWVIGLKSGVGFDYHENYSSRPAFEIGPLPAKVTLTLDGAQKARIIASNSSSQLVENVEFLPAVIQKPGKIDSANISGAEIVRSKTNDRGVAAFDWLPKTLDRPISFIVFSNVYSCADSLEYQPDAGLVDLKAHVLHNTLAQGTVRYADGQAAGGILVRAEGRGATTHYCRMQTRSAPDGSYAVSVEPDQSYIFAVIDARSAAASLTGKFAHEGEPLNGLDFTLGDGTLIRGLITKEPGTTPAVGEVVTLTEKGSPGPAGRTSMPPNETTESLVRWAKADASGQFDMRVGPGRYELFAPSFAGKEELTVVREPRIVRDFRIAGTGQPHKIDGYAIEQMPAGERPMARAIVEASPPGGQGFGYRTIADGAGRFQLSLKPGALFVVYVRDHQGLNAGFTSVKPGESSVRALAGPASRIRGQVVDSKAQPQRHRRVQLRLDNAPDYRESGHFFVHAVTGDDGRYEFTGVVTGANAEVTAWHSDRHDPGRASGAEVAEVVVHSPDAIEVPRFVVPAIDVKEIPPPKAAHADFDVDGVPPTSRPVALHGTRSKIF